MARLFAVDAPLPGARPVLAAAAATLGEDPDARHSPSDFAQALFDLGATLCTARSPACALCPWRDPCRARQLGLTDSLPRRTRRGVRPPRFGAQFVLQDASGRVLLRRRPAPGLFAGMTEPPGTAWRETPWPETEAKERAPVVADWHHAGQVRHLLTHLELRLDVYAARVETIKPCHGFLRPFDALAAEALPTVMRHCLRLADEALGPLAG